MTGWAAQEVDCVAPTGRALTLCIGMCVLLLQGATLPQCCAVGCAAGAAAVQVQGAELSTDAWAAVRNKASNILLLPAGCKPPAQTAEVVEVTAALNGTANGHH